MGLIYSLIYNFDNGKKYNSLIFVNCIQMMWKHADKKIQEYKLTFFNLLNEKIIFFLNELKLLLFLT